MSMKKQIWAFSLSCFAVLLVSACSSRAPGTKPDDMSVDEHREEAEKHQKMSSEHQAKYDPNSVHVRQDAPGAAFSDAYTLEVYNPTKHHSQSAKKHGRHAEQHREAAQDLLAYEEQYCAKFPEETRTECPLMGRIESIEEIEGGVRITFHEATPIQATVDHMRCHFAFARTEGYQGMQTCPLYLEGVSVEPQDDGRSVELTTDKPEDVGSLRKRTRAHLD